MLIDSTTRYPAASILLAERLATKGVEMPEAPVSGGDKGAIAGTLSIIVGGKSEELERYRPSSNSEPKPSVSNSATAVIMGPRSGCISITSSGCRSFVS